RRRARCRTGCRPARSAPTPPRPSLRRSARRTPPTARAAACRRHRASDRGSAPGGGYRRDLSFGGAPTPREMPMPNAVIVDDIRTPLGRRNGRLAGWHPVDLAAHVLDTLMVRHDLDPAVVDDVIMGCVSQVGEQALN